MKSNYRIASEKSDIQEDGNLLLLNTISRLKQTRPDLQWVTRPQEDQKDRGVDFEVEIVGREIGDTGFIFKIQNKGHLKRLSPIGKKHKNGYLSYPLKLRNAKYYRHEINVPLIFTVCDLEAKRVYWHAIQLDNEIDELIEVAEKKKSKSITIYLDPKKFLDDSSLESFLIDVHNSIIEQSFRYQNSKKDSFFKRVIAIDKSKHIVDQLYDYLSITHQQLNYIPISTLIGEYPFKSDFFMPTYSKFILALNNKDIVELFDKVEVENFQKIIVKDFSFFDKVECVIEKLEYIFKTLSNNLIYELMLKSSKLKLHFHINDSTLHKSESSYNELKLLDVFQNLDENRAIYSERMSQAYTYYKLGDFMKSASLFEKISSDARKSNQNAIYFICQYNLQNLGILMRYDFWGAFESEKLINKYISIDLEKAYMIAKGDIASKFLFKLKDKTFFSNAQTEIERKAKLIIDHYYSQLNGGWQLNNYSLEIINHFAELDYCLNNNFIIYDKYVDFEQLFERFVEALFASHAMKENQTGKFEYFDDWILHRIVFYGNHKWIVKYFNRYRLSGLKYIETTVENDRFLLLVKNFFLEHKLLFEQYDFYIEKTNRSFPDFYEQVFGNILSLTSLIDFDKNTVNQIFEWLSEFLINENCINYQEFERLGLFIRRKSRYLSNSNLEWLFKYFLYEKKCHSEIFFISLIDECKSRNFFISLNDEEFNTLIESNLNKCGICENEHSPAIIIRMYEILKSKRQKGKIKNRIEDIIERNLNSELYYIASVFDFIPFNEVYFERFKVDSIPNRLIADLDPENKIHRSVKPIFRDDSPNTNSGVDKLINLCFKYKIELDNTSKDAIKSINKYYEWLIEMEEFDYSKFNPEWLNLNSSTTFYFNIFEKHPKVKTELLKYLERNKYSDLNRLFLNLYYLKPGRQNNK